MTLEAYVERWRLTPAGEPIVTPTSLLFPVTRDGVPAMLKLATIDEERRGADLMAWWGGDGAARVLAHEGDALLMERATGAASLAAMARTADDDEATRIICATAARLHATRPAPPLSLAPLERWFASLWPAAANGNPLLRQAATVARALLDAPRDIVALHGDLHHENILDFGPRGWLAIDPKGLIGERGFDFANILRNPDETLSVQPGRFARQVAVIAEAARLERKRLLHWVLALCGLSASWYLEEGEAPDHDFAIAALAAAELRRES